ncbi:transposase, partial [Thermus scotoductus]
MHPNREHPLYYLDAETLLVATYVWVDDELKAL